MLTMKATSIATMKHAQRDLAKTLAEYDKFKKYKMKTTISNFF